MTRNRDVNGNKMIICRKDKSPHLQVGGHTRAADDCGSCSCTRPCRLAWSLQQQLAQRQYRHTPEHHNTLGTCFS